MRERRRRCSGLASPDGGSFGEGDNDASATGRERRRRHERKGARGEPGRGAQGREILVIRGRVICAWISQGGSERASRGSWGIARGIPRGRGPTWRCEVSRLPLAGSHVEE